MSKLNTNALFLARKHIDNSTKLPASFIREAVLELIPDVTLVNSGSGQSLVSDGNGPELGVKSITAGAGVSLTSTATNITINNTVSLYSGGSGVSLVSDGSNPTLGVKSITAGTATTLSDDGSNVTINSTGSNVSLSSAGGTHSLVGNGVGPSLTTRGLTPGTGVTISSTSSQVTINSTGSNISLSNAGTGESLVFNGAGPSMSTKGLGGSQYITVRDDGANLTLLNTLYSAGSWVPTMSCDGGDVTFTINNHNCQYVKIGNLVTCHMFIGWNAKTGTTNGHVRFSLPFTPTSSAFYRSGGSVSLADDILFGSFLAAQVTFTVPYIHIIDVQNPSFRVNTSNLQSIGEIQMQVSYIID
jgi:hypothetical protein